MSETRMTVSLIDIPLGIWAAVLLAGALGNKEKDA